MSEITRRQFVRTAASTAISVGAISTASAESGSEIEALAHLEATLINARERHLAACRFTDSHPLGSIEEKAAYKAQGVFCTAECRAEDDLIAFEPRTYAGLVEKARAMHRSLDWGCEQEGAGEALMRDILAVAGGSHA